MAYSVGSLGDIIKEYAKKQKSLSDKVKEIEKKRGVSPNQNAAVRGPPTVKGPAQKRPKEGSVDKAGAKLVVSKA